MDKHLLQHYDTSITEQKCLACDWTSDICATKPRPDGIDKSYMESLFKDIGAHLKNHHMITADGETFDNVPKRRGFKIASSALRCIECNVLQEQIEKMIFVDFFLDIFVDIFLHLFLDIFLDIFVDFFLDLFVHIF